MIIHSTAAFIFFATIAFGLLGCREIPPLQSGTVVDGGLFLGQFTAVEKGNTTVTWDLTHDQLDQLFTWFQQHRARWSMVRTSPPHPSYSIVAKHVGGRRTQLDLFAFNESWSQTIRLRIWDEKGKFIDSGEASFSNEEIRSLHALLRATDLSLVKPVPAHDFQFHH